MSRRKSSTQLKVVQLHSKLYPKSRQQLTSLPLGAAITVRTWGDSLTGAGILNGDTLRICRADTVNAGELAAIYTPYGLMVRLYAPHHLGFVELRPANSDYPTLCLHPNDIEIVGRVVSVKRDLRGATVKGGAR